MAEFYEREKQIRLERGMSMQEVADAINTRFGENMNRATISRYESNDRTPSIVVASYFARLYGVSLDYLVGLVDDPMMRNDGTSLRVDYVVDIPKKPAEVPSPASRPVLRAARMRNGRRTVLAKKRKKASS